MGCAFDSPWRDFTYGRNNVEISDYLLSPFSSSAHLSTYVDLISLIITTLSYIPCLILCAAQFQSKGVFSTALKRGKLNSQKTENVSLLSMLLAFLFPLQLSNVRKLESIDVVYTKARRKASNREVLALLENAGKNDMAAEISDEIPAMENSVLKDVGITIFRKKLCGVSGMETGKAPVFVYFHGGGWVLGDRHNHSLPLLHAMAAEGWIVATCDYRLAPRVSIVHCLLDCKKALAWVVRNISDYGGDPDFIIVGGESAGGHLALMVGLTDGVVTYKRDPGMPSDPAVEEILLQKHVKGIVDIYGVTDLTDSNYVYRNRDKGNNLNFQRFIEKSVIRHPFIPFQHEFVRNSPYWWLHPQSLQKGLHHRNISVHRSLKSIRHEYRELLHLALEESDEQENSNVFADMEAKRDIPPIMIIHGEADTLVPCEDSNFFWSALLHYRESVQTSNRTNGHSDLFVKLPYAHHAFNFLYSPRSLAMNMAILDWTTGLYKLHKTK